MAKQFEVDTGGTLTTGLQAYYKLEDATEYYVGGGTLDMTNNGGVTFVAGKVDDAGQFVRASNQYLSLASSLAYSGGPYSMAGWYRVDGAPGVGDFQTISYAAESTTDTYVWMIYRNNGGTFQVTGYRTKTGVANQGPDTNQELTVGTWYHLAFTYDGAEVRTYLNASLLGGPTAASGSGTGSVSNETFIGASETAGNKANGLIDELGFWSKALSTTEITDLYNGGAGQTMIDVVPSDAASLNLRTLVGVGT